MVIRGEDAERGLVIEVVGHRNQRCVEICHPEAARKDAHKVFCEFPWVERLRWEQLWVIFQDIADILGYVGHVGVLVCDFGL